MYVLSLLDNCLSPNLDPEEILNCFENQWIPLINILLVFNQLVIFKLKSGKTCNFITNLIMTRLYPQKELPVHQVQVLKIITQNSGAKIVTNLWQTSDKLWQTSDKLWLLTYVTN